MRKYTVDGADTALPAAAVRRDDARLRGLGERHWRLLLLIAQHGVLDTLQITTLMFGSRPSAARHLNALLKAGLLWRFVNDRDSAHLAHYEISTAGAHALEQRLRQAGQPVPIGLGQRGRAYGDQLTVNEFFVRLVAHARRTGDAQLYRWRHALDTAAWLRAHGVGHARADGYGMWIEHGATIGFLLHLDHDEPSPLTQTPPPPPSALLTGYRRTTSAVPADAVLVVTPTDEREQQLHHDLAEAPAPLTVAATTYDRLGRAPSPAEAIWTVPQAPTSLLRLLKITRRPA